MKTSKGNATGRHWGELPARETHKQEVITPDIIDNVWRQVMDETRNPSTDYHMEDETEHCQLPVGNLHVLNTINLHQHLRALEDGTIQGTLTRIDTQCKPEPKQPANPFHFLHPRSERTELHDTVKTMYLKPETAHSLLKHSVIVLLAHIGFERSSDIAIETLTDTAEQFIRRMTLLLKTAAEQKEHGFPDTMERVLCEAGIGGAHELHDYYQADILRYEASMKLKVEKVVEEQKLLELNANNKLMTDQDEVFSKVRFEELDEFGNAYREVPTLQLLDPDMGFPPSLDAGFQMLHSLEQEELNSLEVEEEEVNVSDSPNTSQQQYLDPSNDKKKKI